MADEFDNPHGYKLDGLGDIVCQCGAKLHGAFRAYKNAKCGKCREAIKPASEQTPSAPAADTTRT
jgi:hypothetical protein